MILDLLMPRERWFWAQGHYTTWAHDKIEWTLSYLMAGRRWPKI